MKKKELPGTVVTEGPRMLPRVTLTNGKTYFIDQRLNQLRNVADPYDYIDDYVKELSSDDLEKVKRCSLNFTDFISIHCGRCNEVLFTGTKQKARSLSISCPDCSP